MAQLVTTILTTATLFALCALLAFSKSFRRRTWIATVLSLGSVLTLADFHNSWSRISHFWRPLLLASFLFAVVKSRRALTDGPKRGKAKPYIDTNVIRRFHFAMTGVCLVFIVWTLTAFLPSPLEVGIASPLRAGVYAVASGGSNLLTNPRHWLRTKQKYAVDLVKLNGWGTHARKFLPSAREDYVIWHEPVYAPCAGLVFEVDDKFPDLEPGESDADHRYGNQVTISCEGGFFVKLAHLGAGTVLVHVGQHVDLTTRLGLVGATGNTLEPHLHIQTMVRDGTKLVGVPFLMNGSRLVRNRLISIPQ